MASTEASVTNPRGIPTFPFLPSVSDYVKSHSEVEATLQRFQEMISKYQFMQQNVERRAEGLREKLPEMKKSLDTVKFLRSQKTLLSNSARAEKDELDDGEDDDDDHEKNTVDYGLIHTTFPLQDTLYAHATIDPATLTEVYLWLGANVMVAYPLDEAEEMLSEKLEKARESLKACEEDLEFIRVQTTTLEVATARVHNWDVGEKRRLKGEGTIKDSKDADKDDEKD